MDPSLPSSHPLFSELDPDKAIDVGFIQVRRREDGVWKRAAHTFTAAELPSFVALQDTFGGGEYELVARCSRNRRVTSRVRFSLHGEAKPLGEIASAKPRKRRKKRATLRTKSILARRQARALELIAERRTLASIVDETGLPFAEVRQLWQQAMTPLVDPQVERQNRKEARDLARMMKEGEREDLQRIRRIRTADHERERAAIVERVLRLREKEASNRAKELELVALGIPVPNAPVRSKAEENLLSELLSGRSVSQAARGAAAGGGGPSPAPSLGDLADLLAALKR